MKARGHDQPHDVERQHEHGPDATGGAGYHGHAGQHAQMVADFRRRFWASLALTVPVIALAPVIQRAFGMREALRFRGDVQIQLALASVVYSYGGWPFLRGIVNELRRREPGMMTLIAVAITVAYAYSAAVVLGLHGEVFFWELTTLIDVMLLGHWIEMRSVMGASAALESLVALMPSTAHRLRRDGGTEEVPVTALRPGERVLVKPGEKIPTDGTVTDGRSSVNQALLTGESQPVDKGPGAEVMGGSINGEGAITVAVSKTGEQTYLAQVVELVKRAQESRSHTQDLANRAAMWLTVVALSAGSLTLAAWLALGMPFEFSLEERGAEVPDARHPVRMAQRHRATHDDILDLGGIDAGALDCMSQHVRRHRDTVGLIERASRGARNARPAIGDDRDVLHVRHLHRVRRSGAITVSRDVDASPPRWHHADGGERSLDRFGRAPIAPANVAGTRDDQVLGHA